MIGLIAASLYLSSPPVVWAKCPPYSRLLYAKSGADIAYHDIDRSVVVSLDKRGKPLKSIKLAQTDVPMFVEQDGVHTITQPKISNISSSGRSAPWPPAPRFVSNSGYLFLDNGDITLVEVGQSVGFDGFDLWSGIGINPEGTTLVSMSMPMDASLLSVARYANGFWARDPRRLTPSIEKVGICTILPGYCEIAVIGRGTIAFLGCFTRNATESTTWESTLKDFSQFNLSVGKPTGGYCYLFVTRLDDGLTRGFAKLSVSVSPERAGPFWGTLNVSSTSDAVFLKVHEGILRIPTLDLMKVLE